MEHNAHTKANEGHPILLTLSPMQDVVIHYAVALKVATEPLQYKVGAISTTQLEAPNKPWSFTTMESGSEVTSSVQGTNAPKSNKIHKGLVGGIKYPLVEV